MPLQYTFIPKAQSPEELQAMEAYFYDEVITKRQLVEEVFDQLHAYFMQAPPVNRKNYADTFWRWYIIVAKENFNRLSREEFLQVFPAIFYRALIFKSDILTGMLTYLMINTYNDDDLVSYYLKLQRAILESSAMLGIYKGKEFTLHDVSEELKKFNENTDSIRVAEFYSRLKDILFGSFRNQPEVATDEDFVVARFITFINFLITIDQTKIAGMLFTFKHGEEQLVELEDDRTVIAKSDPDSYKKIYGEGTKVQETGVEDTTANEALQRQVSISEKKETSVTPILAAYSEAYAPKQINYTRLAEEVLKRFKTDKDGQIDDIEGVMKVLNALATDYKDDTIRELYYFDEKSGMFKWRSKK